jgi:hypothetical protein
MAVDTRNKRASAINLMLPWRGQLPAPDGTIDELDRAHVAFLYAGIAIEELDSGTGTPSTAEPFTFNLFIEPLELDAAESLMLLHMPEPMALNLFIDPMTLDTEVDPLILRLAA